MDNKIENEDMFNETPETFMIYVVEHTYYLDSGKAFFSQYLNEKNYISDNDEALNLIKKILNHIRKNLPSIANLLEKVLNPSTIIKDLPEVINVLAELFSTSEHKAVNVEVINPIIIKEDKVSKKSIEQITALYENSSERPVIIIILRDNNFERAKGLLQNCPNGMNVKFIRNDCSSEIYKIINCGTTNLDSFINSFSGHCFSTCSKTKRDILVNEEWSENSVIRKNTPSLLQIRSELLYDNKDEVRSNISDLLFDLNQEENKRDEIINSFICMAKLFKVYCDDYGGNDIVEAYNIAKELDNELLLAHVYRLGFLFQGWSIEKKKDSLIDASIIFRNNGIEDHSIYALNNRYIFDFYNDKVNINNYTELVNRASKNVPGLVGMSIVYNNAGVACLYSTDFENAISYFSRGLDFTHGRIVQKLGLMSNLLIAKDYSLCKIDDKDIQIAFKMTIDTFEISNLDFIAINYLFNILIIAHKHNVSLKEELFESNKDMILRILKKALKPGQMGTGSLVEQLTYIDSNKILALGELQIPTKRSSINGVRLRFVQKYGYNPIIFNAWL